VSAINNIIMLPVSKLYHHPDNPRIAYDDIEELSDSIRSMGILQNLTVVPYSAQDHGMVAVAACPSDKVQDAVAALKQLRTQPFCPPDAWILKNE